MAYKVLMPKWGLTMEKGIVVQWLKEEGDRVEEGEELLEVESEKATNVVESPASGILARIVHPEGSEVMITKVIAIITEPGEEIPDLPVEEEGKKPLVETVAVGVEISDSSSAHPVRGGVIRAVPVARRLARENGLDLASLSGSGPNGTITKGDVESALAASRTAKPLEKVAFYSEGHRLDGLLYTPHDLRPGERRAAVVLCVGYTYTKELVLPDIARVLNAAGYVALIFDYRGFGASEGIRWRLIPQEQVNDIRAALTFLADLPQVNEARLALVGLSLGGSHAISAAAVDERVEAVVALEAPGDGGRWLRSLRRHYEWQELQVRLDTDRSQRVRSGKSSRVDPLDIMLPDPDSKKFLDIVYREYPEMKCDLPMESADALIEYSCESLVSNLAPRPLLLIHGQDDHLVPSSESSNLFAGAGEPKRLEILPGIDHFNWVSPKAPGFKMVTDPIVDFLSTHLPAS